MKIRYIISENWEPELITEIVQAAAYAANYFRLEGRCVIKLINTSDTDEATCEKLKSKRYEVRIARNRLDKEPLRAIFHELTHIKQYAKDGLKFVNGCWQFRGEPYDTVFNLENYLLSPWEMEARAMEEALMLMYEDS